MYLNDPWWCVSYSVCSALLMNCGVRKTGGQFGLTFSGIKSVQFFTSRQSNLLSKSLSGWSLWWLCCFQEEAARSYQNCCWKLWQVYVNSDLEQQLSWIYCIFHLSSIWFKITYSYFILSFTLLTIAPNLLFKLNILISFSLSFSSVLVAQNLLKLVLNQFSFTSLY